jgi:hypothetical protein
MRRGIGGVAMTNPATEKDRVLDEFHDDQMGLPVLLRASVRKEGGAGSCGIIVPDIPGLEAAMAVARVMDPFKLNGTEIKFLRRAVGAKGNELARFLDVKPETVSRWENGKEPISVNAERILRLRVFNALKERVKGVPGDLNTILDMKICPVRPAGQGSMIFRLAPVGWVYEGTTSSCASSGERISA